MLTLWAAAWLVMNPWGNTPMTDDWAYAFAVRSVLAGEGFRLTGFTAPNLIAQAYWGALFCWPVGFSYQALRLSTTVLALVGLLAAFGVFRALGADRLTAAAGALTLGANPLFLQLSDSFMTDVPFIATALLSLWLYLRGAERERAMLIVAAYALAMVSLMIRQFAFALPIAFGVAHVLRRGLHVKSLLVAAVPIVVFAAAHLLLQHWIIAASRAPHVTETVGELVHVSLAERMPMIRLYLTSMTPYFGLFCLPFIAVLVSTRRLGGPAFWAITTMLGLALAAFLWVRHDMLPTLGNGLAPYGVGPLILFDTYFKRVNVPDVPAVRALWVVLTVGGALGTALLLTTSVRFVWRFIIDGHSRAQAWRPALLLSFSGCVVGAIVAATLLDQVFDRYLIVLIVPLAAFLLVASEPAQPRPAAWWLGLAPLALCLLLSIGMVHDYFATNRVRWRAIATLERNGVPANVIDGGFEFGGDQLYDITYQRRPGVSWWWIQDNAYAVALGPLAGYETVETRRIPLWMPTANYRLYLLRRINS